MSETNKDTCPHCGADHWRISATLIQCAACEAEWGRVNGVWIEVPREDEEEP